MPKTRKRLRRFFFARGASFKRVAGCLRSRLPARLAVAAAAVAAATSAAAAVTAAAEASAASAAAWPSVFARARLVDGQGATAQFLAVELCDGGLALLLRGHLDEAEAARAARVAILDDRSRLDRTGLREQFAQVFAGSLEREIPDVKFNGHVFVPLPSRENQEKLPNVKCASMKRWQRRLAFGCSRRAASVS